jgi:hypothetical protein
MRKALRFHWVVFTMALERNIGWVVTATFLFLAGLTYFSGVTIIGNIISGMILALLWSYVLSIFYRARDRQIRDLGMILFGGLPLTALYIFVWWYALGWVMLQNGSASLRIFGFLAGFIALIPIRAWYLQNKKKFLWIDDILFFEDKGRP